MHAFWLVLLALERPISVFGNDVAFWFYGVQVNHKLYFILLLCRCKWHYYSMASLTSQRLSLACIWISKCSVQTSWEQVRSFQGKNCKSIHSVMIYSLIHATIYSSLPLIQVSPPFVPPSIYPFIYLFIHRSSVCNARLLVFRVASSVSNQP